MKKSLALLLTLIFAFSCFSILGIGTVSAEENKVILESAFEKGSDSNWQGTDSNKNVTYKTDTDGSAYAQVRSSASKNYAGIVSAPFELATDKEYELSFYIRVPSESNTFLIGSTFFAPTFALYEPKVNSAGTKVTSTPTISENESENNYYAYKKGTTWVRRAGFTADWTIGDYGSATKPNFSNFAYGDQKDILSATKSSINEAYKDWTKITAKFTALAGEEGETSQVTAFAIYFNDLKKDKGDGYIVDVKDFVLTEMAEESETPETPDTPDTPGTPVTPEAPEAEGCNKTFEGYNAGDLLYSNQAEAGTAQTFYVYEKSTATLLTDGWGDLTVTDEMAYSGTKSLTGRTYFQTALTPVNLEPNTEYTLSFWFAFKNSNPDIYVNHISYGIYTINTAENKIVAAKGTNTTKEKNFSTTFKSGEWKKILLTFTTGDNTDNLFFGYNYNAFKPSDNSTPGKTPLFIDDIIIKQTKDVVKSEINVDATTSVSVDFIGTNRFDYFVGEKVQFKVVAAKGLTSTVYLSSSKITPDANGVYSFNAVSSASSDAPSRQKITVQCSGDPATRQNNRDKNGYPLDVFNETLSVKPIWEGNTVYHENVLFIPGRETAKLIYPISEIISVRSYDLYTNYIKGVDYDVTEDGQLKILEGSRIPVYTKPLETTSSSNSSFPIVGKENTYAAFVNDYEYPAYAISVTYEHTEEWEDGYHATAVESVKDAIPNVFEKLEKGEDVNVVIYGDSASCGWSTSGLNYVDGSYYTDGTLVDNVLNIAPYTLPWPSLLENQLKKLYPNANITFKNSALSGKTAEWGAKSVEKRLGYLGEDWETDLMILAYGGNDLKAGHSPETFKTNMQNIINNVRKDTTNGAGPDTEVLLWSQYICNTDVEQFTLDKHLAYREVYLELAEENEGVALSDTLAQFAEILKSKEIVDIFNNNVNHGNDFLTRVIAQCLISSLSQPEYIAGDISGDEKVNLYDLVALARQQAGWDVTHNKYALDVDGNDELDLADITTLAKHLANWEAIEMNGTTYPQYNKTVKTMSDASGKMKLSNRTFVNDNNLLELSWSYSGFTVQGHFSGEFAITNVKLAQTTLVYAVLDGDLENANQVVIKNNADKVVLLGNIEPGFHTIQLIKASEGHYSASNDIKDDARYANNITIGGISYNGTLFSAPAEKERKIEFIGDSLTATMGLYTKTQEPFWWLRTDFTKGYAVQVADYFDADLGVVACSNGSICSEAPYMYDQYQKLYFDGPAYDFTARTEPDIVVINLAANDIPAYFLEGYTNKLDPEKTDVLAKGVQDMLTMVRRNNPNAKILWVCGMVEVRCVDFIKEQVEAFAETDGNTMYAFIPRHDCSGQGGHPTPEGQADNAEDLIAFIESNIWTK